MKHEENREYTPTPEHATRRYTIAIHGVEIQYLYAARTLLFGGGKASFSQVFGELLRKFADDHPEAIQEILERQYAEREAGSRRRPTRSEGGSW